jgi:ketosteroid isomerase-like protein
MAAITNSAVVSIKAVLDSWEAAWNASDMNAMWQLATDDIHWVNVVGMHWRGKAEVQRRIRCFLIYSSKTDRANLKKSKAWKHCLAAHSLRSCAGQWAAIDGQMGT